MCAAAAAATTPMPLSSSLQPGVQEVVLDGCHAGVGLGLDDTNRVTLLKPQGRAAVSGLFGLGDRIVSLDGEVLGDRQLQMLLQVKERHVFGVERLGSTPQTPRSLEEAFPEAWRASMSDLTVQTNKGSDGGSGKITRAMSLGSSLASRAANLSPRSPRSPRPPMASPPEA